jgi:hypothetical protein
MVFDASVGDAVPFDIIALEVVPTHVPFCQGQPVALDWRNLRSASGLESLEAALGPLSLSRASSQSGIRLKGPLDQSIVAGWRGMGAETPLSTPKAATKRRLKDFIYN